MMDVIVFYTQRAQSHLRCVLSSLAGALLLPMGVLSSASFCLVTE